MRGKGAKRLTALLARLPGVGEKTAQRYLYHLLAQPSAYALELGDALRALHAQIRPCLRCGNYTDVDENAAESAPICDICSDPRRSDKLLCVVARPTDVLAMERPGSMRGRYFVLGKLLSPLDGVGPEALPIGILRARIEEDGVEEIILATPPSVDGEATALFLRRELAATGVLVTRIASGVPHGGDLEFADAITLGRALDHRQKF